MTAKKPLSGSNSTPKSAWNFSGSDPEQESILEQVLKKIAFREPGEAMGLTEIAEDHLQESGLPERNIRTPAGAIRWLRQCLI